MLSIGKLASGQARYYLEQAHGRVDRVLSVSSGVEDYYLDGAEPDGVWMGAGARGAQGRRRGRGRWVAARAGGRRSVDRRAARSPRRARVPGFDVTFSAPKSVSVLFGIGDERMRATIRRAHEVAVARCVRLSRARGRGGASWRGRGDQRRAGAGSSRPHSGTGLRVPAIRSCTRTSSSPTSYKAPTDAGRRSTAAGFTRTARPPATSTRRDCAPTHARARRRVEACRNGIADIDGVPTDVLRGFSRRRAEIEAELEQRGQAGPRAAQVAASAHDVARTMRWNRGRSCASGAGAPPSSASSPTASVRCSTVQRQRSTPICSRRSPESWPAITA